MTISEKITNLRKEKNLSQEALAEALGVSRQSVSKWESGTALPDTDKIVAMSELFGVSTDYLLKNDAVATEPVTYNPPENPPENPAEKNTVEPERNDDMSPKKKKKKKGKALKIIALVLALVILAAAIGIPSYFGSFREAWWELNGGKVKYPYVLVHGLGGWGNGDGINDTVQYWGATSMNLVEYLNEQGYEVHAPSVGPVSSTWDRACELYAQLTGTRVDYGEAHSAAHNHERFGREYSEPLVAQWGEKINGGQRVKINLIGHSFGGATVRLLSSLLEHGSEEEKTATEGEISPLFEGGKGDWVYSVTALCAPHNGSSLTEVLDSVGGLVGIKDTTDMLTTLCFGVAGLTANTDGIYDFKLEHFGITDTDFNSAIDALTNSGNDHAVYDLTPDGASELNKTIKVNPNAYYFSYSYSTTKAGSFLRGQVPNSSTLPILYPFALAMGSFKGTTDGGISIDETWQENDGLVSVVSARYPFGDEFVEMPLKSSQSEEEFEIQRGIWNVAPTKEGDHGKVIGLNSGEEVPKTFFTELFTMVDELER